MDISSTDVVLSNQYLTLQKLANNGVLAASLGLLTGMPKQ